MPSASPVPVAPSAFSPGRVKLVVGAVLVLIVAVLAYFFVRAMGEEKTRARWDRLAALRDAYEPNQDPFAPDTGGQTRRQRETYIERLTAFLDTDAKAADDALEPYVRWLIAKASGDVLFAMRDVPDFAQRKPHYDRAIDQLTILRDRFPDFPANWNQFAPPGEASSIRMFLKTMEANRKFEESNLPKDRAPPTDVVLLLRTERGDVRLPMYSEDAPEAVGALLKKAREGRFDGTAFYEKIDRGTSAEPEEAWVRAGDPATRGAKPYDRAATAAFGKGKPGEQILPAPSRYRLPLQRGMIVAWHPTEEEYDETGEFLVLARRSPKMDYSYTPLGKAVDVASLETLDRLFAGKVWGTEKKDEKQDEKGDDKSDAGDVLQAPVKIVKALVYKGGTLWEGADVTPIPERVAPDESEKALSTLKVDQYKVEPPAPPATEKKPEDDKPAGGTDATGNVPPDGK